MLPSAALLARLGGLLSSRSASFSFWLVASLPSKKNRKVPPGRLAFLQGLFLVLLSLPKKWVPLFKDRPGDDPAPLSRSEPSFVVENRTSPGFPILLIGDFKHYHLAYVALAR